MIVIRGGDVLTPEGWKTVDVAIDGATISSVGRGIPGETEIDARGCLVGPGFVDMHTHLRDPGHTWKEDIRSASVAAASGGFTAITAMPNTVPAMDTPTVVSSLLAAAAEVGLVDVVPSGALTSGRAGAVPSDIDGLYQTGVRLFTDDGDSVAEPEVLRDVMLEVAGHPGAIVAQHAEDATMTDGAHIHEGSISRELDVKGIPPEAEAGVVARDLELVEETGVSYHCQHVSARMTIELIRRAKESGMPVTAEVTPHHLIFDDASLAGLDTNFKMYPPLRSGTDRDALLRAVRDGTIDTVATDHAPHLPEEKAVPFDDAPRGVIGLETAASALWEAVGDPQLLYSALSVRPARILGLESHGQALTRGAPANLVVFDPSVTWEPSRFASKSSNSPFRDRRMSGRVRTTLYRGRAVYSRGVVAA